MKFVRSYQLLIFFLGIYSCGNTDSGHSSDSIVYSSVKDNKGKEYKTVKIGELEWMAENLDVAYFNNGDPIPEVSAEDWNQAIAEGKPAWCYIVWDGKKNPQFGKIYNWYAVSDPRGIAPEGWHISTIDDWWLLLESLTAGITVENSRRKGLTTVQYGYKPEQRITLDHEFTKAELDSFNYEMNLYSTAGKKIKSTSGWRYVYENKDVNGTNESGFNALPSGCLHNGATIDITSWWTLSELDSEIVHTVMVGSDNLLVIEGLDFKEYAGLYVRCVKNHSVKRKVKVKEKEKRPEEYKNSNRLMGDSIVISSGSCKKGMDVGELEKYFMKMEVVSEEEDSVNVYFDSFCLDKEDCDNIIGKIKVGSIIYVRYLKRKNNEEGPVFSFPLRDKEGNSCAGYLSEKYLKAIE